MRLIDADKLMSDIEHYHLSDGKFQHWVEIQPTIEPEPHWIPCSERNPKETGWYIVTLDDGDLPTYRFYSEFKNLWEYIGGKVIAWMPLPEQWKGDTE